MLREEDLVGMVERLGGLEKACDLKPQETVRLYQQYLNPVLLQLITYVKTDKRFVKAQGPWVTDDEGQRYLDFFSGFGALNLGHEPPEILEALKCVEGRPNLLQNAINPFAAKLAEYLAVVTPGDLSRSFFCSSGTEAVEAALKLARKATGREVLLSTDGAFHGKTYGALSVSGKEKYRKPFAPLLPGTERVPYNDLSALEARVSRNDVAGFIVEPIQGENGVIVPESGYLKGAENICRKYGTLLLADEIQTGFGRTGRLFACEEEHVEPDVLILSKSLGGGVMPIGAMVTTDAIWKKAYGSLSTGVLHSTTFGGNTRACACGIAAIDTIVRKRLPRNAREKGEVLLAKLRALSKHYDVLTEVRGRGLMIGLSFARLKGKIDWTEGALALWVARQLVKKHRILTVFTLNNYDVLRIAPPLGITEAEVEFFLEGFENVLKSAQKFKMFGLVQKNTHD